MSAGRFNLSALAVRERSVTLFLIILISVAGLVAFFGLGRAEDPPFTVKQMTVITVWPGATAQEMQDQVAEPLEKRLQELKWYDRTETYTRPGMALITLSLQDQTPPSEVPEQFYQARKKLGDEAKNLPAGVSGPMMNDEFADVTFAIFALKARGEPPRQLVRDAEALRQQLLHVPGVKKVNILGEQAERIYLSFSHDRLATLGLSPEAIFAALNSQNVLTAAGAIETRGGQIFIRLDGAFDRLQQIRDTPIIAGGRTLKLADVATVERGYEDPATFLIRHQGEPALLLGVVMREGWNGLALGKALDAETASINQNLPLGMSLTKVTDQSVNISAAVDEFMIKFFVALLVVMAVCFVSMGWRVGVVVAAAVPLTLAVVFVVMAATGKNFDRITLGSLILALGLLVDDAIIAIEMMVVKMEEGYDRLKASAYAWSHTAAPMLAGTLVTAVGFMPNGFAQSTAGEYASRIAGVLAGIPAGMSATYAPLTELTAVTPRSTQEQEAAIKAGKLILIHDGVKAKIARGVNSLTTIPATGKADWSKIKIVEGMDLLTYYLRTTIQDQYVGRYANTYDNKCVLVTAIQTFLAELEGQGVLSSGESWAEIDVEAQEKWMRSQGIETADMTAQEIKEYEDNVFSSSA